MAISILDHLAIFAFFTEANADMFLISLKLEIYAFQAQLSRGFNQFIFL